MATPKQGYRNKANKRVPGTTTVIGRFKDSGGLLWWAFEQGKLAEQGIIQSLYDNVAIAADIGTMGHSMFEAYLHGLDPQEVLGDWEGEKRALAQKAFDNAANWLKQTHIEVIPEYQEIYMVSEEYQFGGTPDAIGRIDGKLVLLDWKTSNGTYPDHLIQVAAYKHLWEENHPDMPIDGGLYVCRFAKEYPDFVAHYFSELDAGWEQFKLFRQAYDIDKELKKRAK